MKSGLLMVYTSAEGNGSEAAFGQTFRSLGRGLNVCIVQFVERGWNWDKLTSAARLKNLLDVHVCPEEFTWKAENLHRESEAAHRTWQYALEHMESDKYRIVVLDELGTLMGRQLLDENEVVDSLASRPEDVTVIVTGREAPESLMKAADLVTEVKERKESSS